MVDTVEQQLENNKQDYNEIPAPLEGVGFNAEANRDQFLGGGGSETKATESSSVPFASQTAETPNRDNKREQRSKYRHELVERLVQLEREALKDLMNNPTSRIMKLVNVVEEAKRFVRDRGKRSNLMETATVDAFWNSGFTPPVNHSEEAQKIRDVLAESAREEHEEWLATLTDEERRILREASEFDQKQRQINEKYWDLYPEGFWLEKLTDEEREIWDKALELQDKSYPINQRFREEHYEAERIAVNIGFHNADRNYNWVRNRFGYWVGIPKDQQLEGIAADQKGVQKKDSKTEAKSADKNVEANESTTEQTSENFTVRDASGNYYHISLQGDLTVTKLVEALKAIGAGALATQVETLSKEQNNLPTLLSAAKITVTPLR